jgi:transcriptional regulator with XRE-family HTH domain
MNLETYLERNNLNYKQFADGSGVSAVTIWRILKKKFTPRPGTARKIEKHSKGKVTIRELLYPDK